MSGALVPGDPNAPLDPDQQAAGSPPDQATPPAAGATPAATAPISTDVKLLQREYTQATQLNAAIRKELGLPKEATAQDLLNALAAARRPAIDGDQVDYDPAVVERLQSLEERGWAIEEKLYGPAAIKARAFAAAARTSNDPSELMPLFFSIMQEIAAEGGTGAAPEGASAQPTTGEVPPLGGGDTLLQQPPTENAGADVGGRRQSGDMIGFIRQFGFGRGGNSQQG